MYNILVRKPGQTEFYDSAREFAGFDDANESARHLFSEYTEQAAPLEPDGNYQQDGLTVLVGEV